MGDQMMDTNPPPIPLNALSVETLGVNAQGPVLRLRRAGGDLVLRWLETPDALLPLVEILGRSRHPALVLPCRMGIDARGKAWMARPFCEGATLQDVRPVADDPRWHDLIRQWLEALDALHAGGWLHRDVKAANLLVGPSGAKLFDLDLAAPAAGAMASAGTRRWLAPEVLSGQAPDARSDLFGLGVAVVRALLGNGSNRYTEQFPTRDFWSASALDPMALPAALRSLLQALVERDPKARPVSAMAALALLPGGQPADGTLSPPPLLGRSESLLELARSRVSRGQSLVIVTDDPCDQEAALPVLACAAALEQHRLVLVEEAREERDVFLASSSPDSLSPKSCLLVHLDVDADGAILAEALAEASAGTAGALLLAVVSGVQAEEAERALGAGLRDSVEWHRLDAVPLEGLEGHLASQARLSSREVIAPLARDLHARSNGQQSVIEAALSQAEALGVARHLTDGWILQRDRWPEGVLPSSGGDAAPRVSAQTPDLEVLVGGDLKKAIESLERTRREGRLAAARTLADRLGSSHPDLDPEAAQRIHLFQAELDLAEGALDGAMHRLDAVEGGLRADAVQLRHRVMVLQAELYQRLGRRGEALAKYKVVLAESRDPDDLLRARVGLAHLELLAGDFEVVLAALLGAATDGAKAETAGALHNLRGGALVRLGRLDEARAEFESALAFGRASEDRGLAARALLNRALVERRNGRFAEAEASLEEAAGLAGPTDLLGVRALVMHNLGTLLRDRGDLSRARLSLERALRLRRRAGDEYGIATTVGSLALLDMEQGVIGRAAITLGEAQDLLAAGGHEAERALIEVHREMVETLLGDPVRQAVAAASESTSLAHARRSALRAQSDGDIVGALSVLRGALADPSINGGVAERFRTVSLAHALEEDEERRVELAAQLVELGETLGPARVREARFRTAASHRPDELLSGSAGFGSDGRLDLEWAAVLQLAAVARGPQWADARRRASRRAAQLADHVLDQVPAERRAAAMDRVVRLARGGSAPTAPPPAEQLSLEWFSRVNRQLAASEGLEELLALVLDQALECTGGRRGLMLLRQPDGLEVLSTRHLGSESASGGDRQLSSSLVRSAMESGDTILTQDIASDPRFSEAASVQSLELRAILCVPIMGSAGAFGAVYVDDDRPQALFDETDARALRALANQAGAVARQLIAMNEIRDLNARLEARVASQKEELVAVRTQMRRTGRSPALGGIVGESPAVHALRDQVRRLARTDLPVLITGPSGSGKELVARALHGLGLRDGGPLVVENMAAFSEGLMESELFGHARGAFTGASGVRVGLFEEAHGGTLFLDEIADLQMALQAKLLRVLESGEFRRVGESSVRHADVRLVAATNADMAARVAAGDFRQDLYYRLNAAEVRVPSLDERREDIPLLVEHFLNLLRDQHGVDKGLEARVLRRLTERAWPGEIRELRNEVQRLFLLSGEVISDLDLVREPSGPLVEAVGQPESYALEDAERRAIVRALEASGGNRAEAARRLEVSRAGFYNKLRRFGLDGKGPL